jgi:hypothetical protein
MKTLNRKDETLCQQVKTLNHRDHGDHREHRGKALVNRPVNNVSSLADQTIKGFASVVQDFELKRERARVQDFDLKRERKR